MAGREIELLDETHDKKRQNRGAGPAEPLSMHERVDIARSESRNQNHTVIPAK
jgi:hypothetical protein